MMSVGQLPDFTQRITNAGKICECELYLILELLALEFPLQSILKSPNPRRAKALV